MTTRQAHAPRPSIRAAWAAGASLVALTTGTAACAATAMVVDAGPELAEVVITAEKREATLQDTPIAMSVLGGQDLRARGVETFTDLMSGQAPSLRVAPFSSRVSALAIGMRGIVPADATQMSRDTGVGVYVDGVYLARVHGLGGELYDIDRIEILKGPQGTLFGRNSVGGALNILTRQPTGELGLSQTVGFRNYNGFNSVTHLNLPKTAGFSAKIDAAYSRRDGITDNVLPGQADWGQWEKKGLHADLLWEPTSTFSARYSLETSRDESVPYYTQLVALLPGAAPLGPLVKLQTGRVKQGLVGVPQQPSVGVVQGNTLHLEWSPVETLQVRSITAHRQLKQTQFDDGGAGFLAFTPNSNFSRYSLAWVHQSQFSQELQLVGSTKQLQYVGGLYYFREHGVDGAWTPSTLRWNADGTAYTVLPAPVGGAYPDRASEATAVSRAAYGQVTWTPDWLDSRLHLTAGGRFTADHKKGRLTKLRGVDPNRTFLFKDERFDPTVTAAFDVTDDLNVYAKWGTAYRAGGANSRSATFRPFGAEDVRTAEIGLKSELWDRRARVNLAAYHTDYRDLQIDFSNPANLASTETVNTDQPATIEGFEADVAIQATPNLLFSGAYAYTSTELPPQRSPFTGLYSIAKIPFTPEHAFTLSADYTSDETAWGTWVAHVDLNHSGAYFSGVTDPEPNGAYTLVNARLTLRDIPIGGRPGALEVSVWGKNLTDDVYRFYDFDIAGAGLINARSGALNEPRTYGLELTYRY